MTAKKYLRSIRTQNKRIDSLIAEKDRLKQIAEGVSGMSYDSIKVQSARVTAGNRQTDAVCKLIDIEERITYEIDRYVDMRDEAAQMKKKTQQLIAYCIMQQLRGVRFEKPVRIAFTWCEPNRKRDKDNIAFAKKFIFDALVESGVIPNDGWKNIESFSDSFMVDARNPRVEVEIKEVEE